MVSQKQLIPSKSGSIRAPFKGAGLYQTGQPAINIRHAESKDMAALHQLLTHPDIAYWTTGIPFSPIDQMDGAMSQFSEGHYVLVATSELDEVIGSIRLISNAKPRMRHVAKISAVAVHPNCHGCGVGKALMTTAIDFADHWLNLHRLELLVYVDNASAIALYQKFGFEIEGTLRDVAFRSGHYVDAYLMARLH